MLSLRHEKFKHKDPSYENFLEKISTYVISNFKDGGDLKPLFRRMVDPTENLRKKKNHPLRIQMLTPLIEISIEKK